MDKQARARRKRLRREREALRARLNAPGFIPFSWCEKWWAKNDNIEKQIERIKG